MTANAQTLERESDRHRGNVEGLIEELRSRLTAGEILDQVLGNSSLSEMGSNLGAQAKRNPMALAVAAGGLAWMMMSDRNPRPQSDGARAFVRAGHDAAGAASDAAQSIKDTGRSSAARSVESAAGSVKDSASAVMETAGDALDAAKQQGAKARAYAEDTASAASEAVSGMAGRAADYLRHSQPGARLDRLAHEQPLLLAGIGFAAGMLLGAGIPLSEIENELLGEQSDQLKAQARETVREGVAKTKEAASAAYDAAAESLGGGAEDSTELPPGVKPDGAAEPQPWHH